MSPADQLAYDLQQLTEFKQSRAWAIINERLQADIMQAALGLARSASMPVDEIHFRRGAIYAAQNVASLPDVLIQKLTNELALLRSTRKPATAGSETTHEPL